MCLAVVDVGHAQLARRVRIAVRAVAGAAILENRIVAAGDDADRGVVVGAGGLEDDTLGLGSDSRLDRRRVVDLMAIGQRVGLRLVERVGPGARGGVRRPPAVAVFPYATLFRSCLAVVDVGHAQLARRVRIAVRAVAGAAILENRIVAAGDDADRGVVVGAG